MNNQHRVFNAAARLTAAISASVVVCAASAQSTPQPLNAFYVHYRSPGWYFSPTSSMHQFSIETSAPPMIDTRMVSAITGQNYVYPIDFRVQMTTQYSVNQVEVYGDVLNGANGTVCRHDPVVIDRSVMAGTVVQDVSFWRRISPSDGWETCKLTPLEPSSNWQWSFHDTITFGAPVRRNAQDGAQYDASPMSIMRDGNPWQTLHWGYRLGLVASTTHWDNANLSKVPSLTTWPALPDRAFDFDLTTLPPPWVEDNVVEYVNRTDFPNQPGGQYFYAVLAADKTLLDSLPQWQRTGKSFKSGGYVSVCRFYGGKNGGPNTHFYSADDKECAALKAIPQLSYEGQTFAVNMPMPAKNAAQAVPGALRDCPVDSKPLYRVYNNASNSNGRFVSNHRYLIERADVTAAIAQGWVDEGHVMCVPL